MKSFSEYVDGSFNCRDTLNFTIQQIICPNSTYIVLDLDLEIDIQEDGFSNISRKACDLYSLDVCVYNINADDSNLIYCEVLLKDDINKIILGSHTLTLGLYICLRTLFKYTVFPGYNITDAIATKMASRVNMEWGTICFFGSLANIISPIAVGKIFYKIVQGILQISVEYV